MKGKDQSAAAYESGLIVTDNLGLMERKTQRERGRIGNALYSEPEAGTQTGAGKGYSVAG